MAQARRVVRGSRGRHTAALVAASIAGLTTVVAAPREASAQQATFHLDRMEVAGAPDDGIAIFRPATNQDGIFFGQLAIGYSLNPLKTSQITVDPTTRRNSAESVIHDQLSTYATAGFEFADRLTLAVSLPIAWEQDGHQPYQANVTQLGAGATTAFSTTGPAVGDARIDFRYVAYRTLDRKGAIGLQLSVFAPSGTIQNFGGDGSVAALPMITGEYTLKFITFVANTGIDFRPTNGINAPASAPGAGLGIGNEWRWAVGAFIPIKDGKYRIGGTIFGQTGLSNNAETGNTIFTANNTPIEWQAEARMKLGLFGSNDKWWASVGGGSRLADGYGAPDFRIVALLGAYVPIIDSNPPAPDRRVEIRRTISEGQKDTDHDGIPDELDPCPLEPEDHKDPDPNDGCPAPKDTDGDGIPDNVDKCPTVAEDKDGIEDNDGCPEEDVDKDGIPDATDACPREPGQPNPDPKKNGCPTFIKLEGSQIRILQQVHFATGSATILADSFPMLQEIVNLLKANPSIKKLMIEGHTDDQGADAYNLNLSKLRAASVKAFIVQHGIDAGRLDSQGYGETRPIDDNKTAAGRAKNRRVEFKITEEDKPDAPAEKK
jgi:OmpA-OmpF porin, OOP family